jgi:hypothetical protein
MKINLNIPTGWCQLSEKQLLIISELMLGENTAVELQTKAFSAFCKIRILNLNDDEVIIKYRRKLYVLQVWQFRAAQAKMAWITQEVIDVNPLPKIVGRKPVDKWMQGTLFLQYLAAENFYQAFLHTKDTKNLANLASVLYPRKGTFNQETAYKSAEKFLKLPPHKLNTIFIWYTGIKSILAKKFPNLFQTNTDDNQEEYGSSINMREVIDNMMYTLNQGDITKNKQIYESETWAALYMLDMKALEYKKMLEKIKK